MAEFEEKQCQHVASLASEYLERDLPAETCAAIGDHLAACPACRSAAAGLESTIRLCREYRHQYRPGPLPADRQRQLREALERTLRSLQSS